MPLRPGDVVVVPFPYSDHLAGKRRPAVVVSSATLEQDHGLVWVAMIIVLIRVLLSPHQTGKAVAQLSILSGGFLLTTVLGPMILSGSGNLSTFHSGSSAHSILDRADTIAVPDIGQQEASQ